jgi:hypothetical protein
MSGARPPVALVDTAATNDVSIERDLLDAAGIELSPDVCDTRVARETAITIVATNDQTTLTLIAPQMMTDRSA